MSKKSPKKPKINDLIVVPLAAVATAGSLVESLCAELNQDMLFWVVQQIDDRVCDLAFTKRLAAHFAKVVSGEKKAMRKATKKEVVAK